MNGWEVLGWIGIGCVGLVMVGFAAAIAVIIVKAAIKS